MGNIFVEFLQGKGLYEKISITEENAGDLYDLLDGKIRINAYCKGCGEQRVFSMKPVLIYEDASGDMIELGDAIRNSQNMLKMKATPRPGERQS